jgi:anti-sigma factor RsiW
MEPSATSACEGHEIALEKRADGQLAGPDRARLEAHLDGCSSCRRYEQHVERMQAVIETGNATVDTDRTWRRVSHYVVQREARDRRKLTIHVPLAMVVMTAVLLLSLRDGPDWRTLFAVGFLVANVGMIVTLSVRRVRLRRLAQSPRDLLSLVRRELSTKRISATLGALASALLGLAWLAMGFGFDPEWLRALGLRGGAWFSFAVSAIFLGYAAYLLVVAVPRLRREGAEFEPEAPDDRRWKA